MNECTSISIMLAAHIIILNCMSHGKCAGIHSLGINFHQFGSWNHKIDFFCVFATWAKLIGGKIIMNKILKQHTDIIYLIPF